MLDGSRDQTGALSTSGTFALSTMDISTLTDSATDVTTLNGYIAGADAAIASMTTAGSTLGAVKSRIDIQKNFISGLKDAIDNGIGQLVDADMNEEFDQTSGAPGPGPAWHPGAEYRQSVEPEHPLALQVGRSIALASADALLQKGRVLPRNFRARLLSDYPLDNFRLSRGIYMIGQEQLERLWTSLLNLGTRRLAALALVGLTVFGGVAFGSYYLSRPVLEPLYVGLTQQDATRMGGVLREAGIPFDIAPDGSQILVPYGHTAQARMLLAERGLPSSANAGYELFDKLGPVGLTSFMQDITRVRALEGEIARTVQTMKGVKAARVHIVLSDEGSFRRNRQAPSASVVIRTEGAGTFTGTGAVRQLVAAAIPGLTAEQVTVLDTNGTILAAGGDNIDSAPSKMVELEKVVADELKENVRHTLIPYLGLNNFEISVATRLNTDKQQINETKYDPDSARRAFHPHRQGDQQHPECRQQLQCDGGAEYSR